MLLRCLKHIAAYLSSRILFQRLNLGVGAIISLNVFQYRFTLYPMQIYHFHIILLLALGAAFGAIPLQAKPTLVNQAIAAFEAEDFPEASALIDQATEGGAIGPDAGCWYYRGVIYEKLLRSKIATDEAPALFEETLAAYNRVLATAPQASQYHSFAQMNLGGLWAYYLDRGRRYYKQENFESAIMQFQYCRRISANDPYADLYTAVAAHQQEEYDLALSSYTSYMAAKKTVPTAVYHALARLTATFLKDPDEALAILEKGLAEYPFNNNLLHEEVAIYTTMGTTAVQAQLLKKETETNTAVACYQLGYWYGQQEREEEALVLYQKAGMLDPQHVEPFRQQGIVYYNQAVLVTQEITKIPEEDFQKVGVSLIKQLQERLASALTCFEQAQKIAPRDLFILRHLQITYQGLNKPAKAKKMERRLRRLKIRER